MAEHLPAKSANRFQQIGRKEYTKKTKKKKDLLSFVVARKTLPVVDELIRVRIAGLALHDIGLGRFVGQRDGRHLSQGDWHKTTNLSLALAIFLSLLLLSTSLPLS